MFECIKALVEAVRYDGVMEKLDMPEFAPRSPTQRGKLGPGALAWCDENLPKFKLFREQAEAARGK